MLKIDVMSPAWTVNSCAGECVVFRGSVVNLALSSKSRGSLAGNRAQILNEAVNLATSVHDGRSIRMSASAASFPASRQWEQHIRPVNQVSTRKQLQGEPFFTFRNLETTEENGGPRGGAGRRQLLDGYGEEQKHTGRSCKQENHFARSQVYVAILVDPSSFLPIHPPQSRL